MEKRYVGTLHKIDAALYKIKELTSKGYSKIKYMPWRIRMTILPNCVDKLL